MQQICSIFVLYLVAVCSFDSLTNLFLFCVLSQSFSLWSLSTRWLRGSKIHHQQASTPDNKVYITVVTLFFNVFAFQYVCYKMFPCSLPVVQNKIYLCFTNWCKTVTFGYILKNYQEEVLCWYYISHQLVRTWCGFNDLHRLCCQWGCKFSGYHILYLFSLLKMCHIELRFNK